MAGITATVEHHDSVCSDGVTKASTIHVDGPDGAFDWCGGRPDIENLIRFLDHLRLADYKVAQRLTVRQPTYLDATSEHRGR